MGNDAYNDKLEKLWQEFGDVIINYPDEETGEYLEADPDGELNNDWFVFKAGTSKMDVWHWFDDEYDGGVAKLMFRAEGKEN